MTNVYSMSKDSKLIFEKYWKNYYCEKDPLSFLNKMNMIQLELIKRHYPDMDDNSRLRADNTIKILENKINKFNKNAKNEVFINNTVKENEKIDDKTLALELIKIFKTAATIPV